MQIDLMSLVDFSSALVVPVLAWVARILQRLDKTMAVIANDVTHIKAQYVEMARRVTYLETQKDRRKNNYE